MIYYNQMMDNATKWIDLNMELASIIFASICGVLFILSLIGTFNRYIGRREKEEMLNRARQYGENYFKQIQQRLDREQQA